MKSHLPASVGVLLRPLLRLATAALVILSPAGLSLARAQPLNAPATNPDYVLAIGDTIAVVVTGEPELAATQLIDRTGSIRLSLVGDLKVAAVSVRAAVLLIAAAYRDGEFLRKPEVQVFVVEYAPRFVTVFGAVRAPGKIPFARDLQQIEILDVITQSGGLTPLAKGEAVSVTRTQPDGSDTTFMVDVAGLMSGKRREEKLVNIPLFPGDRVFVPERLF